MIERLKSWARRLKLDTIAVFFAARDLRTPVVAKVVAVLVAVYALSPIDLIPDFIPVIGYLDDLLLVPAGLWLAMRLIPAEVMAEARVKAEATEKRSIGARWVGAGVVVLVWVGVLAGVGWWVWCG